MREGEAMTDYQKLSEILRTREIKLPVGQASQAPRTSRTSAFEFVHQSPRKDGRELLQLGIDHLVEPRGWSISISHAPGDTEGTPLPLREIWVSPDQVAPLLDLLESGVSMLQGKQARQVGSPNVREEIGAVNSPSGVQLRVLIQGYDTRWNLKITGPGDEWLPFDGRDFGAFIEGFAKAFKRLGEVDDGIPF
jgi:hypothetical protein